MHHATLANAQRDRFAARAAAAKDTLQLAHRLPAPIRSRDAELFAVMVRPAGVAVPLGAGVVLLVGGVASGYEPCAP